MKSFHAGVFNVTLGFVTQSAQFRVLKVAQTNFHNMCLLFEYRAAHLSLSLPPAEEFVSYRDAGSLAYPSSSRQGCAALYCRLIPHVRLYREWSPVYLCLRVGLPPQTPSDTIRQSMDLVPHKGAPGFFLPGC